MKRWTVRGLNEPTWIPLKDSLGDGYSEDDLFYISDEFGAKCAHGALVDRLADYEDTGLTPEECALYVKCDANGVSKRELKLGIENDQLKRKLDEASETKYIIQYHDKRGLYDDVLVLVVDEVDDGSLEQNFTRCPNEIVMGAYKFDDDGWWEVKKIERIDYIPKVSYTE